MDIKEEDIKEDIQEKYTLSEEDKILFNKIFSVFSLWVKGGIIFMLLLSTILCLEPSYLSMMKANEYTIIGDIFITIINIILYLIPVGILAILAAIIVVIYAILVPVAAVISLFIYLTTLSDSSLNTFIISGSLTLIEFVLFIFVIRATLGAFYSNYSDDYKWLLTIAIYINIILITIELVTLSMFCSVFFDVSYYELETIYQISLLIITLLWLFFNTFFIIMIMS